MAILYLGTGINNQAKKVKKWYIGVNEQAKKVKRAYIGINGQAKLFYRSDKIGYINQFINNVVNLTFNISEGYSHIINSSNSEGYIWSSDTSYTYPKNINTECDYIYLYSNSYRFFYFYANDNLKPVNIEQLGFNYVTNLSDFQSGGQSGGRNYIYGNISKINCDNVINASNAFWNCKNITGNPTSMPKAQYMDNTYYSCINLIGNPVCGNLVTNFKRTYEECTKLNGPAVCGSNVTSMYRTYFNCINLSGNLVCGPKVGSLYQAYSNCKKCRYAPNFHFYGNNLIFAFENINTYGNFYFHNITSWGWANYSFSNRMTLYSSWNQLNIYLPKSMSSQDTGFRYWFFPSGDTITWTTITNGSRNTLYNIYIYNNL